MNDVCWLGILLAPLAAVPTRILLSRRPQHAGVVAKSCAVVLVLFAARLVLLLHLRNSLVDDFAPALAFAALCAVVTCSRSRAYANGNLSALALAGVIFAYIIVLAVFGITRFLPSQEPTTTSELSPGFVCKTSRWAIPGDGGTWTDLYEVLPYAPFLMRFVDSGSASDNDGGFECEDALASYRIRHVAPGAR